MSPTNIREGIQNSSISFTLSAKDLARSSRQDNSKRSGSAAIIPFHHFIDLTKAVGLVSQDSLFRILSLITSKVPSLCSVFLSLHAEHDTVQPQEWRSTHLHAGTAPTLRVIYLYSDQTCLLGLEKNSSITLFKRVERVE